MKRFTYILLLALGILFFAGNLFITPHGYSESYTEIKIKDTCLLVDGSIEIKIEDKCPFIEGSYVGEVEIVLGQDSIIFRPEKHSCWTVKGAYLFESDVIQTSDTGIVRFNLTPIDDKSKVTLDYRTILQITECIIDQAREERLLYFDLRTGNVRFYLDESNEKTVKIKTKILLAKSKGSDFLIEANDESTKITTFRDNHLEVINLAFPDDEPVTIMDFQSAIFKKDDPNAKVYDISLEEAEKILQEFPLSEYEVKKDIKQGKDLQEKVDTQKDKDDYMKEKVEEEMVRGIFVSEDELVEPDPLDRDDEPERPELIIQKEDPITIPTDISNEEDEEPIVLPDFPGPPF